MADEIKLKPGEELILTIPSKAARDARRAAPARRRKGIIRGQRRGEVLPRRVKQKSVINLYDMGQLKNLDTGLFADIYLGVAKEIEPFQAPPEIAFLTTSERAAIATTLTSIANRTARFKKIVKAEAQKYGISIKLNSEGFEPFTASNPKFTEAGYEIPGSISEFGLDFNGGLGTYFVSSEACKVTALPSYSAPAVSLGLSGAVNCFIAPGMSKTFGSGDAPDLNFHWLGFYHDIIPRLFLDLVPSLFEVTGLYIDNGFLNASLDNMRDHPLAQNVFTTNGSNLFAGGSLPNAGAGLTSGRASFSVEREGSIGGLMAILEGSGGIRYIWATEDVAGVGRGISIFQEP